MNENSTYVILQEFFTTMSFLTPAEYTELLGYFGQLSPQQFDNASTDWIKKYMPNMCELEIKNAFPALRIKCLQLLSTATLN